MPNEPFHEEPATEPDWGVLANGRLPDGGPRYVETPADPLAPGGPFVAEPWNAVTATFFIWIALAWLWRLRGRYRDYPFVSCCMPLLLAGGVGGTLFHGTRVPVLGRPVFFLLDVVPISLLGLAGSMYMAFRYVGRKRVWVLFAVLGFYWVSNQAFFTVLGPMNRQLSINLSYVTLATMILAPIALVLWHTRFRHGGWVAVAVVSFGIAWVIRLLDQYSRDYLVMGTHWIWHTFGAISTAAMVQFFYKVEGEAVPPPPPEPVTPR